MSATDVLSRSSADEISEFQYRPLAATAIAALTLGILSTLIFVAGRDSLSDSMMLAPLPLLALFMAWRTRNQLRDNPGQYSGGRLAAVGSLLAAVCLVGGVGYSSLVYATEVRDGYQRISFLSLRPDQADERAGRPVPTDVATLSGQKVFIKGYMRPPDYDRVNKFLLVRDNQQCCYGDISQVKYYDQVWVELPEKQLANYSTGVFRVHGTLQVAPELVARPTGKTVYSLQADFVE
ncbi:MAG: hypothetical protein KF847_02215 [Pirellulales bacterium]|nr:hypothetical protein [Pirellulales bacterium]